MRIALCQINTTQGDLDGNVDRIRSAVLEAERAGARVALLPELALPGYCPRDLLLRASFMEALATLEHELARTLPHGMHVLFGSATPNPSTGHRLLNVAVHVHGGRRIGHHAKTHIPNYDVFDEGRYFASGPGATIAELDGMRCGVTICEDIWGLGETPSETPVYAGDPPRRLVEEGAGWLANLSASPYCAGRPHERELLVVEQARRLGRPVALVNLVGGNDEVLFDGHSLAVDADGGVLGRARGFDEDILVVDIGDAGSEPPLEDEDATSPETLARIEKALVMGVRDYATKSGFTRALVGLSGGIDSAVTAAIAARALGADSLLGVGMPSRYSADMSLEDARGLTENLGIEFRVAPIAEVFDAALASLEPHFGGRAPDTTEENMQARIRGLFLMSLSNKLGALLLTTGNKSELAVGYCTLYGDMCGGLAVISDLPKTLVYALARHINRDGEVIPQRTIDRPPSAELRPDQKDTDSLPDYQVLDDVLCRAVERGESVREIIAAGHDETMVRDVLDRLWRNEYKRKQMPPGLRVTSKAFGAGRRMPITGSPFWFDNRTRCED